MTMAQFEFQNLLHKMSVASSSFKYKIGVKPTNSARDVPVPVKIIIRQFIFTVLLNSGMVSLCSIAPAANFVQHIHSE